MNPIWGNILLSILQMILVSLYLLEIGSSRGVQTEDEKNFTHKGAWGETDDRSKKILTNPTSVPDLFATIFASVGIDYRKNLYDGDRPVPITDGGVPIAELFV